MVHALAFTFQVAIDSMIIQKRFCYNSSFWFDFQTTHFKIRWALYFTTEATKNAYMFLWTVSLVSIASAWFRNMFVKTWNRCLMNTTHRFKYQDKAIYSNFLILLPASLFLILPLYLKIYLVYYILYVTLAWKIRKKYNNFIQRNIKFILVGV